MVYTAEELEQINEYKEKLEKRREYNRLYMANKRANDIEFYTKQKAYNAQRKREIYSKQEDFKQKEKEYKRLYAERKKEEKQKIEELIAKGN